MAEDSRVAIVTGSNVGIGLVTVKGLCEEGWEVILACRNPTNGQQAVEEVKKAIPNAKARFMLLDLADLSSVRQFSENFHKEGLKLNALVNNAGVWMGKEKLLTKDGFELTVGTNHLGHFLLTCLLLDVLKKTASECGTSTVVNISSTLHDYNVKAGGSKSVPINLDDMMYEKDPGRYNGAQAYKDSKLMNVLFTYELARRLEGTGVTVNCMCPGFIPSTRLGRNFPGFVVFLLKYILSPFLLWKGTAETEEDAKKKVLKLVNIKDVTGKFFKSNEEHASSEESYNEEYQKRLWDMSVDLVKLDVEV